MGEREMKLTAAASFLLIAFVLTAIPSIAQPPDTLWTRTYGGTSGDNGWSVLQTDDGGYITTGGTHSFGQGGSDVWLFKTDSDGNEIWSQTFGGTDNDDGYSVRLNTDGGFIIVGRTRSFGAGSQDVWLIRTDSNGDELWSRTFGGIAEDFGYEAQQTVDGGFIITGWTESFGAGLKDVWLIKTDSDGNEMWSQTFGGALHDEGASVLQAADGGYIIAGYTYSFGAGSTDAWLIKTDSNGNELWSHTFGSTEGEEAKCVQQSADGGYIITGNNSPFGEGFSGAFLLKTDSDGNGVWLQTFGGADADRAINVQQTSDGGYIMAGDSRSFSGGSLDVWLVKTDSAGNGVWDQTFTWDESRNDYGKCVQQTADGGYVITGYSNHWGDLGTEAFLIRLDACEIPPVSITMTPQTTPIRIPANGGEFFWSAEISNSLDDALTIQGWIEIILPNGMKISGPPLMLVNSLTLEPGQTINTASIRQNIPSIAPAGNYLYVGRLGFHPNTSYAFDSFQFRKLNGATSTDHTDQSWATSGWNVEEDQTFATLPSKYALESIYPNPFNPTTTITVNLPNTADLSVMIYNVTGQQVAELANGQFNAGVQKLTFDATRLSSGIYFVQATVPGEMNEMRKIVFMK
jgi:Secretion system C-terminal sorting domain